MARVPWACGNVVGGGTAPRGYRFQPKRVLVGGHRVTVVIQPWDTGPGAACTLWTATTAGASSSARPTVPSAE